MKWTVTVSPTSRPVDWPTAKTHLRIDSTDEKSYVEQLIDAATDFAGEALSSSLMAQTITAVFYEGEPIHLPRGPLIAVTSITDDDGTVVTDYDVSRVGHSDRIEINTAFKYPVTVVYTAGYTSAAAVPASIRQAILCHVGSLYENRESIADKAKTPVPHSLADFYRLKSRNTGIS